MGIVYKALGGLVLIIVLVLGGKAWGAHEQKDADATAQLADYNKAAAKDAVRVKSIDAGTLKLDATFHSDITLIIKTQTGNAQEQAHVIAATPSLAQCQLPADLVRLRREQAAASAALTDASPGS